MATLVIQLARFGDIYQTLPTLKALRRTQPDGEIHLLVRERFAEAAEDVARDLDVHLHKFPTAKILKPIFIDKGESEALAELEAFLKPLKDRRFERVINLSFSPFSSYLTQELDSGEAEIRGYTRFDDGYLAIPDDPSAYFYAQVGIGKPNRFHLTSIFASVAGVDLEPGDWRFQEAFEKTDSVIVHLGASQAAKTYPGELWVTVLRDLHEKFSGRVILVGNTAEIGLATSVMNGLGDAERVENRVGRSSLADLWRWIAESRLVIGADSSPMQIASLTGTPVLNLSCASVSFWETGPLVNGSRVLVAAEMDQIPPARITEEAIAMLEGRGPEGECVIRARDEFCWHGRSESPFLWQLVKALYTESDFPSWPNSTPATGFQRLFEVAELALLQLEQWRKSGPTPTITSILASVDDILVKLRELDEYSAPVIDWFQCQRLRMGPAPIEKTLEATYDLFEQLRTIAQVYYRPELKVLLGLTRSVAAKLREFDIESASADIEILLNSTKVENSPWASVLTSLKAALERKDFIEAADILEYDFPEQLHGGSMTISCESELVANHSASDT